MLSENKFTKGESQRRVYRRTDSHGTLIEKALKWDFSASKCPQGRVSNSDIPESNQRSLHFSLQIPGHQSVFINEPRLSDFKQVLLREGIQAEFVGGVLVCNNMVAVRRVSVLPAGSAGERSSAPCSTSHQ